ncbi:MAG: hypothetical protein SAJ37_13590 [Oscillatoria sp. PMC 1068.18]|nr:hypothetical protein [Oscillatoria sp. PMC 1076.18]MEC4989758.1 hypothetical protein [Oscillatoria sp. PMC 1068.18]
MSTQIILMAIAKSKGTAFTQRRSVNEESPSLEAGIVNLCSIATLPPKKPTQT